MARQAGHNNWRLGQRICAGPLGLWGLLDAIPTSKSTRGGAVAGTMTGGQAKAISAATVEKVTGGKKGGGCKKKDIQEQLDKQTPDDKILRGEAHAGRFNNMPDAVKASQPQKATPAGR
jgi:hypothetical protein